MESKSQLLSRLMHSSNNAVGYEFRAHRWFSEAVFWDVWSLPSERSGHRMTYYDGCLYVFGGYNPTTKADDPTLSADPYWKESKPLFKQLWRFNLSSRKWKRLHMKAPIPDQLASHSSVMHNGKLLVYGGTGSPMGLNMSRSVFAFDLKECSWQELVGDDEEYGAVPPALYGQAVLLDGDYLYTIGGTSGYGYFMDVYRLHLFTLHWECLYVARGSADEPPPRYRHELCLHNNVIYVLGGGTSFEAFGFQQLPGFDLEKLCWRWVKTKPDDSVPITESKLDQYPEPRRCHSVVQRDHFAYVCGGYDGEYIFGSIWRLNLLSFSWSKLMFDIPRPVYFHAAAMSESGKMYIFGGIQHIEENKRTRDLYSIWLDVPRLRDICWEALNVYVRDLDQMRLKTLLKEGIPKDLTLSLYAQPNIAG